MKYPTIMLLALMTMNPIHSVAEEFTPDQSLLYKRIDGVDLKLHIFEPPDHDSSGRAPAIVFFFGGGWTGGNPKQFYPHCHYLASRGLVAMAAEYRVHSRNGTSPRECVQDGKSAIRWIRRHAPVLGIDPDRLIAGGGSAGGHVAAAAATVKGFNEAGEDTAVDCRPQALVLFNPVFDNGPEGYGYDRVKDYWQEISPLHNLSRQTPPTAIFLGTKDHLVPVATAEAFQKRLQALGGRCELHLYEGQGHGFFNYANIENFTATLRDADRFLASLGYLQGPPTLEAPAHE